jgi:HAD superfamily hydrolase (TIGR01509 family)
MIKEGTFVNISGVAIALAKEHGVSKDQEVRDGFLQKMDEIMDASGPGDGLVRLLNRLRKSTLRMGLVTFMRQPRLSRRLDQWKLASYFQSVVTPERLAEFKPSPKPFVKAIEELKVDPADCQVVGDEPVDMAGGRAAGMRTIGLPQGFFSEEELREAGADVIIQSLSLLPDVLNL